MKLNILNHVAFILQLEITEKGRNQPHKKCLSFNHVNLMSVRQFILQVNKWLWHRIIQIIILKSTIFINWNPFPHKFNQLKILKFLYCLLDVFLTSSEFTIHKKLLCFFFVYCFTEYVRTLLLPRINNNICWRLLAHKFPHNK